MNPKEIIWMINPGNLGRECFEQLAESFTLENHLLPVKARDLYLSLCNGLAITGIIPEEQRIVAYTRLTSLVGNWYELGSTWVHLELRGKGVNLSMYMEFLPRHIEKDILATTTNKASLLVGEQLGFVTVQRRALPQEVWQASCTCPSYKIGTTNHHGCIMAAGENGNSPRRQLCYFRVTPETAARHNMRPASFLIPQTVPLL